MSLILIERVANLNGPIIPDTLNGVLNGSEIDAHKFIITATREGAQVVLTGTVTASFLRADGAEVVLTGEIEDGAATVTLAQSCYAVPGRFDLTVFVTADGVKTGVYACTGGVRNTTSGTIIDPGQIVPSVDDVISKQAELAQDVADASSAIASAQNAVSYLAPVFSTSRTYAVGEYVTKDGALYICTTAVETAGTWDATKWQSVTFGGELADLNSAIEPLFDVTEVLTNKAPTGGNNTDVTYNDDGSTTIGTTDNGNTLFGSMLTLAPGDYYLFGVPQGIAFLSPNATGSGSYNNRVFENTSNGPKKYHTDVSINLTVGFRSPSRPSEAYTIYPSLFQLVPKVNRALLEMNALADGTDLNTIVEPGIYLLNSTATYVHAPDIASGIMIVTRAGSVVNQTVNQFGTNARTYTPNLGVRNGTVSGVTSDWKYIGRKYGLRAAMIGDSITWGRNGDISDPNASGFRTEYQIPDVLAHNLGIACDNMGVGSMGWVKTGDGDVKAYDVLSALTLSDYDAIFFCLGVNDGFSPLGAWNSEDETTIMGQFNKCIKYIMTNRPRIRVIVVAPFNGRNIGTFPDYWYGPRDNPQGYVSRRVLSDTLKQACQYYWIPYIEQYDGPINPYSIDTLIGTDGVHPTNTGYIALGQWLSSKIGAVL